MRAQPTRPYHHGDLRPALLRAAAEAIGQTGPAAMSMREVARRAGVSHAAAAYHFGDKAGLLTAVAAQGYRMLTGKLRDVRDADRGFLEVGVAYVRFAVTHRAHFEVMYRPELYRPDDPEVRQARAAAAVFLYGTDRPDARQLAAGAAAWSLVHGLATLWLNGNLPAELGDDPEQITRLIAPYLSIPASPGGPPQRDRMATYRDSDDSPPDNALTAALCSCQVGDLPIEVGAELGDLFLRVACQVERSRYLDAQVRAGAGFRDLRCGVAAVGDSEVELR